jgi:hypothetical protein
MTGAPSSSTGSRIRAPLGVGRPGPGNVAEPQRFAAANPSVTEASRAPIRDGGLTGPGNRPPTPILMVLISTSRVAPAWTAARRDTDTGTERR